jgi:hypothetical protein
LNRRRPVQDLLFIGLSALFFCATAALVLALRRL